jgi:DNA-binding MarR family transcriptional regulator
VSPEDRRVSLLSLAPGGQGVLERIDRYMNGIVESIFSTMTPFERETVSRSLGLLNSSIINTAKSTIGQKENIACCK